MQGGGRLGGLLPSLLLLGQLLRVNRVVLGSIALVCRVAAVGLLLLLLLRCLKMLLVVGGGGGHDGEAVLDGAVDGPCVGLLHGELEATHRLHDLVQLLLRHEVLHRLHHGQLLARLLVPLNACSSFRQVLRRLGRRGELGHRGQGNQPGRRARLLLRPSPFRSALCLDGRLVLGLHLRVKRLIVTENTCWLGRGPMR